MKVTLMDYTGAGCEPDYAIDLLIFSKNTRLQMSATGIHEISSWPREKKMQELEYMANTIPSSWEFIHYTFMIEGVTRAFTHQFVRSRQFSFAQQTMRVLNVEGWEYGVGPSIDGKDELRDKYVSVMEHIAAAYKALIKDGAAIEDARGVLPTNILTNILAKCNMRTFVELVRKRSSPRTQDEYREVLDAMKETVRHVHPWIDLFIDRTFERAANDLCDEIQALTDASRTGPYTGSITKETATRLIKLVDQMRSQS